LKSFGLSRKGGTVQFGRLPIFVDGFKGFHEEVEFPLELGVDLGPYLVADLREILFGEAVVGNQSLDELFDA
jgi:hypothetical protein